MSYDAQVPITVSLEAVVIRGDGTREDLGVIASQQIKPSDSRWSRLRGLLGR